MNQSGDQEKEALIQQISQFCSQSSGLLLQKNNGGHLAIRQQVDGKSIPLLIHHLEDVITRFDSEGKQFLQVNYQTGQKILLTDQLIGFRPAESKDLDGSKLPRVVTTPDLVSIVEALQELLAGENATQEEFEVLRRVFFAVIDGGESIGFDLRVERNWLRRIYPHLRKTTA